MDTQLITGLLTATAAIGGVAIAQFGGLAISRLNKSLESKRELRARLEELADCVHQTTEWSMAVLDDTDPVTLCAPARRVHVLSLLYFPALREDASLLLRSTYETYACLTNDTDPVAKVEVKLAEASKTFRVAANNLDTLAAHEARKLI